MSLHPKDAVLPNGTIMSGNVFRHNILYYRVPGAKLFEFHNVPWDHYQSDYNLVYHFGLPLITGQSAVGKTLSENLLPNQGFDGGQPGKLPSGWRWRARPKDAEADTVVAVGKRSLRITGGVGKWGAGQAFTSTIGSEDIPLKPGCSYRLTAKVKTSAAAAKARVHMEAYMDRTYYWANSPGELNATSQWTPCEFVFTTPKPGDKNYNEKMKKFYLCACLAEPKGELFVTDVSLTEVEMLDAWASWQTLGFDKHSLVADPQFVDAAKDDYRLKATSPAWALGFKPIPVEKIGPYRDQLRATWPLVEAEGNRERPYRAKAADNPM